MSHLPSQLERVREPWREAVQTRLSLRPPSVRVGGLPHQQGHAVVHGPRHALPRRRGEEQDVKYEKCLYVHCDATR